MSTAFDMLGERLDRVENKLEVMDARAREHELTTARALARLEVAMRPRADEPAASEPPPPKRSRVRQLVAPAAGGGVVAFLAELIRGVLT